jgi:hypothetical protein
LSQTGAGFPAPDHLDFFQVFQPNLFPVRALTTGTKLSKPFCNPSTRKNGLAMDIISI